jgi:hypothetical protein
MRERQPTENHKSQQSNQITKQFTSNHKSQILHTREKDRTKLQNRFTKQSNQITNQFHKSIKFTSKQFHKSNQLHKSNLLINLSSLTSAIRSGASIGLIQIVRSCKVFYCASTFATQEMTQAPVVERNGSTVVQQNTPRKTLFHK